MSDPGGFSLNLMRFSYRLLLIGCVSACAPMLPEPQVIIPRSATALESGDHVVFFLPHKRLVRDVEKLFRVSATFF